MPQHHNKTHFHFYPYLIDLSSVDHGLGYTGIYYFHFTIYIGGLKFVNRYSVNNKANFFINSLIG